MEEKEVGNNAIVFNFKKIKEEAVQFSLNSFVLVFFCFWVFCFVFILVGKCLCFVFEQGLLSHSVAQADQVANDPATSAS